MASQLSDVHTLASLQVSGVPAAQTPVWHVSLPLQTLPSPHGVPLTTGVLVHPKTGSQLSAVQRLPSVQLRAVPAMQVPLWHVSSPLQTLPSVQDEPLRSGAFRHPLTALQLSAVQTLASLQSSGVPAVQTALWQVSAPLQTVLSAHEVPSARTVFWHPAMGSQLSVVQALPSLHVGGGPAVQMPLWQVSSPSQTSPSLQDEPLATGTFSHPVDGLQLSVVQTLLSLQFSGVPLEQLPLWQVSSPLQKLPSVQDEPLTSGAF
jgi:hypothetical protein